MTNQNEELLNGQPQQTDSLVGYKLGGKKSKSMKKSMKKGGVGAVDALITTGALVLANEVYKRRTSSRMGNSKFRKGRSYRRRTFNKRR